MVVENITQIPIEQAAAQQFAAQPPVAEAVTVFQPLTDLLKPAMGTISAVVGGLFGLYLIFILARLYYESRKVRLLKQIRYDLDNLNQHFKLPYSQQPKPWFHNFFSRFKKSDSEKKKKR